MKLVRIIAIAVLAACAVGTYARTAADFFVDAPHEVVPVLARNTRLDMLDYFRAGLQTSSANSLDGKSRVIAESPEAVTVQLSRDASMQIAVLPAGRDTVLAVIRTVLTPLADSNITFYDARTWEPLRRQPPMPGAVEFLAPGKSLKGAAVPPFLFVRAEYRPEDNTFRFTNTTEGFYVSGDRPDGLALLRPVINMKYTPRKFVEVP